LELRATGRKEKIRDVWKVGIAEGNSYQVSTAKIPQRSLGKEKKMPGACTGRFQGSIPAGTGRRGTRGEASHSWRTGSTAVPHQDAANALELTMPRKAEASQSSVVSATTHPQATDQRGYEMIRRIHFNFKT